MRRRYKVLSWDYGTNEGVATDGTKFDDQYITFKIDGRSLEPEHNSFLNVGEIISAEESPSRYLYDIYVEEGPRSVRPAEESTSNLRAATDTEIESVVHNLINAPAVYSTIPVTGQDDLRTEIKHKGRVQFLIWNDDTAINIEQRLRNLEAKIESLVSRSTSKVDDHR